jgi:Ca-activated chloride channel family protein
MSFAQPIWLYLIPLLLLLFGGMVAYGLRKRDTLLGHFAASRLLDQLTEQASLSRTWIKAASILLAVFALALALARPQLGVEWTERKARGLDIVFIIDSSKSMLATDIRPSRLDRAKLAVLDLLKRLESDRVGLVAFAGQAFLQTPPTLDYAAFRESLEAVDPGIMTSGGSDLGNAIQEAAEAFPSENNVKVVVLLTDGEDLSGTAAQAAEAAKESGIQVFAIGIGTPEGAYLRIPNEQGIEEFIRDADGQPVRSQLDEATLQTVAQATGGSYSRLSADSLDQLYRSVIATLPREERQSELQEVRIERFQWALAAALLFLVLEFFIRRRRAPVVQTCLIAAFVLCLGPGEVSAQTDQTPRDAPSTKSTDARHQFNRAYEAFSAGEYTSALEQYEAAISHTEDRRLQGDALYNMAHAAHQLGRRDYEAGNLEGALEQMEKAEGLFQSAQELNPQDEGITSDLEQASRVREAVEKLIEEQEQAEQESSDESQQSDESSDSKESEQDGSEQSGDDGEAGESSDQGQQNEESSENGQDQSRENSSDASQSPDSGQSGDDGETSDDPGQSESQNTSESGEDASGQQDDAEDAGAPESDEGSNASEANDSRSTQDPVDDLPPPQPDESGEESGEPEASSSVPDPASEGEAGEAGSAQSSMSGQPVEGMSEADAAALLDSLRGREQLLPFNDAARNGRSRETRDW